MSRRLTPIDIEQAEFTARVRGLDRGEVREFLNRVAHEVEEVLKERQVLERRLTEALEQVAQLQAEVGRLEVVAAAAKNEGAEIKKRAEQEAQLLLAEAETMQRRRLQEIDTAAQRERFELSRLKHQRALFLEQFRGLLEAYARSLEALERPQDEAQQDAVGPAPVTAANEATERAAVRANAATERTDRALLDDSVGPER